MLFKYPIHLSVRNKMSQHQMNDYIARGKRAYWQSTNTLSGYHDSFLYYIKYILSWKFMSKNAYEIMKSWDFTTRKRQEKAATAGFSLFSKAMLAPYKSSDTIYILGSGPSINELTDTEWNLIAKDNSIGFNFFFIHSFLPTFYHMEFTPEQLERLKICYDDVADKYINTPFLANFLHFEDKLTPYDLNFIKNLYLTIPHRYSGATSSELESILRHVYNSPNKLSSSYLVHNRASLVLVISLAVLLDYKNIVLVGVDLNSSEYFFCDEKYTGECAQLLRPTRCNTLAGNMNSDPHRTVDPNLFPGHITIDEVLRIYNRIVLKKRDINLFVYNSNSLLYPEYPAWSHGT